MKNIKDVKIKDILNDLNDNKELSNLYRAFIANSRGLNYKVSSRTYGKKVISDYINSHIDSFKYVISSDSEKPEVVIPDTKVELKPIEKINFSGIKDVMYVGDENSFTVSVEPETEHKIELETDGEVVKVGRDNKTIYAVGAGKGWVVIKATNDLGTVVTDKIFVESYHSQIMIDGFKVKVNGSDNPSVYEELDFYGSDISMVLNVPNLDLSIKNHIDIEYKAKVNGVDKVIKDSKGIVVAKNLRNVNGNVNDGFELLGEDKMSLDLKRSNELTLAYSPNPFDSEIIYSKKSLNLLPDTEKTLFNSQHWESDGVITDTNDGMKVSGKNVYLQNNLSVGLALDYYDGYESGVGNIIFKAKGKGVVKPYLKSDDDKLMELDDLIPSINVDSQDFVEYIQEFTINSSNTEDYLNFVDGGLFIDGDIEIMADSLKMEIDKFGLNEMYESSTTKNYEYTGVFIKGDVKSKYSYMWYNDEEFKNIFLNTSVYFIKEITENLTGRFGHKIYSTQTIPVNTKEPMVLSVVDSDGVLLHKAPLRELNDLKITGANTEIDKNASNITVKEKGVINISGTYKSPYKPSQVIEFNNSFIAIQAPNIPIEFGTDNDGWNVTMSNQSEFSKESNLYDLEEDFVGVFQYVHPVNRIGSLYNEFTPIANDDRFKVSVSGDSIDYKDGIITVKKNTGDEPIKNNVVIEYREDYKFFKIINLENLEEIDVDSIDNISKVLSEQDPEFAYVIGFSKEKVSDWRYMDLIDAVRFESSDIGNIKEINEFTITVS